MELKQLRKELDGARDALLRATDNYGVGNESISPTTFISLLKDLTAKSKRVINYLTDHEPVEVVKSGEENYDIGTASKIVNWVDMSKTIGFKVVGSSSGNYDLAEFLLSLVDEMHDCETALKAANTVFSGYVTTPEKLEKFSGDSVPTLAKVKDTLKEFGEHFKGQEGLDRNLLKELYPSYKGFSETSKWLVKLTTEFDTVKTVNIKTQMDTLDDTLDKLITTARNNKLGKDAAKKIGTTLYNLADWVALYSLFLAKLVSLEKAHRDNVGVIVERSTDD